MESGTLLHIALLRKTSNAKKRQKSCMPSHKKINQNPPTCQAGQQNFILSGWNTEQQQLRIHMTSLKNNCNLRHSFDEDHKKMATQRNNIKTSECTNRNRLKSNSYRKYSQTRGHTGHIGDNDSKLKQVNSHACMRAQIKFHKMSIKGMKEPNDRDQKQNYSSPQFNSLTTQRKQSQSHGTYILKNGESNPHSFTNFINLNNIRARKFFKN